MPKVSLARRAAPALLTALAACGQVVAVEPDVDAVAVSPDAAASADAPTAPIDAPAALIDAPPGPDAPAEAALTLTIDGPGKVFVSPVNLECTTTCTFAIPADAAVKLTGSPAVNAIFDAWTAPGCGTDPTCEFTMTAPLAVGARFKPLP